MRYVRIALDIVGMFSFLIIAFEALVYLNHHL